MYRFIESIKVLKGEPSLLSYHQKRVNDTLIAFGVEPYFDLEQLFKKENFVKQELYKWRIVYDLDQLINSEFILYDKSILFDFQLVEANNLEYKYKYENREAIISLKEYVTASEIIITQNGKITDTTYANLIFLKDNIWYAPKTFLLNGVMRQYLLDIQRIKLLEISNQNIQQFSHFKLINAMNDFENSTTYSTDKIIIPY